MDLKTIAISAALIAGIGALLFWGRASGTSAAPQGGAQSPLTASELQYDFGTISMKDGLVSRTFTIRNGSDAEVVLSDISTSCMCTNAYLLAGDGVKKGPFGMPGHGAPSSKVGERIPSGESRSLEVVYDPNAHGPAGVGSIDRFIYLADETGGQLTLEIKANVTP
ncbi:MAG: DUF1573 domain-containing protein [Candidatus Kaiserbacteria bacterium]|nr:MAG: DUF1573 domain-containing protein [Candidatus Kaiserbacteria bacterium]